MAVNGAQIVKNSLLDRDTNMSNIYFDRGTGFKADDRCKSTFCIDSDYGYRIENKSQTLGDISLGTYSVFTFHNDVGCSTYTKVENFVKGKKHGTQFHYDGKKESITEFKEGVQIEKAKDKDLKKVE